MAIAKTAGITPFYAKTPVMDALWAKRPHTLIDASGLEVGLPDRQMGNSEVGHVNLGAGRIVYQDLPVWTLKSKNVLSSLTRC